MNDTLFAYGIVMTLAGLPLVSLDSGFIGYFLCSTMPLCLTLMDLGSMFE